MNYIIIILFCKTESTHKHSLFTNTAAGKPACGVQRRHLHYNLKRYYTWLSLKQ